MVVFHFRFVFRIDGNASDEVDLQYDIAADPYEWVLCGLKKQVSVCLCVFV